MLRASAATKKAADEGDRLAQTHQAMTELGQAGVVMGAAVAAGVGVAVAKFADFDQAMSNVAATGQDARDNITALREAAIDAGASTVFSAKESANAIEEMAKAGIDAKDILGGGLKGALDLAAAGGLGVADAAGIAATALKTFKLEGEDMTHVADLLAAGAGKAMGDVSDLSMALKQGGQAAALTGLSIEETTASLAAFASQGLLGSDAGTSLKTMLLSLNPTTEKAATLMDELNLRAFDQQGQFIGVAEYAGKLKTALGGMSAEQQSATLKTIYGTDAYRAAAVMLDEGEQGMRKWIAAVDDSGYASETAATRLDNLKGDIEALGGALDSAFIAMGEGVNGPLRDLIQGLTNMVDGFNNLSDPMKQGVLWAGLVTAGIGLLGGAALLAVPKIAAFKVALQTLNVTGTSVRAGLGRFAAFLGGPWAIAAVAATAVMVTFDKAMVSGAKSQAELTNAIETSKTAAEGFKTAFGRDGFSNFMVGDFADQLKDLPGFLDDVRSASEGLGGEFLNLNFNQKGAVDSIKNYGDALGALARSDLPAATGEFAELVKSYKLTDEQAQTLLAHSGDFRDALIDQATDLGIAADKTNLLKLATGDLKPATDVAAGGIDDVAAAADEAERLLSDMKVALDEIAGTAMSMGEANDRAQSAINTLAEAAKEADATLSGTNDASISLRDGLRGVETASRDSAQAILDNGGTVDEAMAAWQRGRDAVIESRIAKGEDREEAVKWADQNLGSAEQVRSALTQVKNAALSIPEKRHIKVTIDTSDAQRGLNQWIEAGSNRVIRVKVAADGGSFTAGSFTVSPNAAGGVYRGGEKVFASGGFEPGIYPYTSGGIHKFAEEYDEAYISGDPARFNQSKKVWLQAGREFGFMQPAQVQQQRPINVNVTVNAQPGMSESQVGSIAADKMARALRGA